MVTIDKLLLLKNLLTLGEISFSKTILLISPKIPIFLAVFSSFGNKFFGCYTNMVTIDKLIEMY